MGTFCENPGVPIGSETPVHLSRLMIYESRLLRVNPSVATRFSVYAEYLTSRSYPTPTPRPPCSLLLYHVAEGPYSGKAATLVPVVVEQEKEDVWPGILHCAQQ